MFICNEMRECVMTINSYSVASAAVHIDCYKGTQCLQESAPLNICLHSTTYSSVWFQSNWMHLNVNISPEAALQPTF